MRDHIPVIGSPGRRPLVPTAWLSPLRSRPVQTHRSSPSASRLSDDVDEGALKDGSVEQILRWKRNEVPQTVSARFNRVHVCTGWVVLAYRQACSLTRGKLRSTPLSRSLAVAIYRYGRLHGPCPPVDIPSVCRHGRLSGQESAFPIARWYEPTDSMLKMRPESRPADGDPLRA